MSCGCETHTNYKCYPALHRPTLNRALFLSRSSRGMPGCGSSVGADLAAAFARCSTRGGRLSTDRVYVDCRVCQRHVDRTRCGRRQLLILIAGYCGLIGRLLYWISLWLGSIVNFSLCTGDEDDEIDKPEAEASCYWVTWGTCPPPDSIAIVRCLFPEKLLKIVATSCEIFSLKFSKYQNP